MINVSDVSVEGTNSDYGIEANMDYKASSDALVTVIIPIRATEPSFYLDRLKYRKYINLDRIYTLIVDDGSEVSVSLEIQNFALSMGWGYIKISSETDIFSSSRARNVGIKNAQSEWVYMDDADIVYEKDHFEKIIKEVGCFEDNYFNFLTIPTIYMSESQSDEVINSNYEDFDFGLVKTRSIFSASRGGEGNKHIQHFAPASGILLLKRKLAMIAGGYDEGFRGWGGEDRDFVYKILSFNDQIEMPENFATTKSWNLNDTHVYEGWRSLYRIVGDYATRKGLCAYHLYHEANNWRHEGMRSSNLHLAAKKAKELKKIEALASDREPLDIIIGYNPFIVNYKVREVYDNLYIWDESSLIAPLDFAQSIAKVKPKTVTLWNPYGTPWRLEVYNHLVEMGITPIVAERGALPDTVYFDTGGLCIVSDSYSDVHWNNPLSETEKALVHDYVDQLRFGDNALEKQSGRVGANGVRTKLGIPTGVKIFFAPLQLYDDTVTMYFSEPGRSYMEYIEQLQKLALALPDGWVLVYKNHPLSIKQTTIQGGYLADQFHINDLIEASSIVSVFNSGTGLLASAFGKTVLYYGPCFYKTEGLNWRYEDTLSVLNMLNDVPSVDLERRDRFFYYLRYKFYSYAKMISGEAVHNALSKRSKLKKIVYSEVRIPGYEAKIYNTDMFEPWGTSLFDVYRHNRIVSRSKTQTAKPVSYAEARKAYHNRDYKGAALLFEQLAKGETGSAQGLRSAAECYVAMGDVKTAKHLLQKASAVLPNNKSLRRRLAKIENRTLRAKLMRSYAYDIPKA